MAVASILAQGLGSAWSSGGTTAPDRTPTVSPGLDPGKYAFELWFNKKRRQEEQKNLDRVFNEGQRQFNKQHSLDELKTKNDVTNQGRQVGMSGIQMLANSRLESQKKARTQSFRNDLLSAIGG